MTLKWILITKISIKQKTNKTTSFHLPHSLQWLISMFNVRLFCYAKTRVIAIDGNIGYALPVSTPWCKGGEFRII